jgi:phosphoribosylaminoimidazolecarboxamide formyltransferase/IMP cyclohydrolase
MKEFDIPQIDLVIVDLYPLKNSCLRSWRKWHYWKIDIGGISLIRAAAKNFKDTVIIASVDEYSLLLIW